MGKHTNKGYTEKDLIKNREINEKFNRDLCKKK